MTSLLVALDGSPFSQRAIAPVCRLADRLGVSVGLWSSAPSAAEADARRPLLEALAEGNAAWWDVVVAAGPVEAMDASRNAAPNEIVCLATHGRNRSAALVPSVSSAALGASVGPVLLVGPAVDAGSPPGRRLAVCIDGGPESEFLVAVAAAWAEALRLELSVLTVAEPVPESVRQPGFYPRLHGPRGDAETYVEAVVAPWRDTVAVSGKVLWDPVDVDGALLDELAADRPELVVMGTYAPSGLRRLILGSTAAAVAHGSPVPVLAVPV